MLFRLFNLHAKHTKISKYSCFFKKSVPLQLIPRVKCCPKVNEWETIIDLQSLLILKIFLSYHGYYTYFTWALTGCYQCFYLNKWSTVSFSCKTNHFILYIVNLCLSKVLKYLDRPHTQRAAMKGSGLTIGSNLGPHWNKLSDITVNMFTQQKHRKHTINIISISVLTVNKLMVQCSI